MRVKLFNSPQPFNNGYSIFPPLGIALLSSKLRQAKIHTEQDDIEIKCADYNKRNPTNQIDLSIFTNQKLVNSYLKNNHIEEKLKCEVDKILSTIKFEGYNLIGFSIREHSLIPALVIAKTIKDRSNKTEIVFGGSGELDESLMEKYEFIDYIINHVGIKSLLRLCICLREELPYNKIPNLWYRYGNKIFGNGIQIPDINDEPIPDFDGLPLDLYRKVNDSHILILPYEVSYGCVGRCTFCYGLGSKEGINKVQVKEINRIISDLKILSYRYKTKFFYLLDSEINVSYDFVDKLCEGIIKSKLDILWSDSARSSGFDLKLLIKMRKAGCIKLVFGVESGNDKTLVKMNKGYTSKEAAEVLKSSSEAGIWNYVNFIAGFPHETLEDIKESINFFVNNIQYIDEFQIGRLVIIPNTAIHIYPSSFGIRLYTKIVTESYGPMSVYAYDEVGGLDSERKAKQQDFIIGLYNRLWHEIKRCAPTIPVDRLYSLYNQDISKHKVKGELGMSESNCIHNYFNYEEFKKLEEITNKPQADIRLGYLCNYNCRFCCVSGHRKENMSSEEAIKEMENARKFGAEKLVFTGGEPTIRKDILKLVKKGKELGFKEILIITNGQMCSYSEFLEKLVISGLTSLCFSLPDYRQDVYEHLTQSKGSFERLMKAIENAKEHELQVSTITAINKLNYQELPKITEFLVVLSKQFRRFFSEFVFINPTDNAWKYREELVPKISDVAPYVHKSLELAKEKGLMLNVEAIPLCYMLGYFDNVVEMNMAKKRLFVQDGQSDDKYNERRVAEGKAKAKSCAKCKYDDKCEGVWKGYVKMYTDNELVCVKNDRDSDNKLL